MIGKTLGHYEIIAPLGAGGMGEVYRARDTTLDREVAIKVLPEDFATDAGRLARFEREAKLLASLNHPNIATIFGFEESDGVRFISMELVEGDSLAERIEASGHIEVDEALEIARRIALALEAAHEAGVIHRDLKPANVQVASDGTVKVLDFGLAKAYEAEGSEPSSDLSHSPTMMATTGTGVIMGTAPYMSPEQARGQPVDKRADIWAFGCVLYEMLTGERTFDGKTVSDTLASILKEEPDWAAVPEPTPAMIQHVLRRCLEKDPSLRLHDIADARIEIVNTIADPDGGLTLVAGSGEATRPSWWRYLPTPVAAGLGVAAVAATFLAVSTSMRQLPIAPEAAMRLEVRLTDDGLLPLGVVLSPDGTQIAYVLGSGITETELYVRSFDELGGVRLVSGSPHSPFFSPDGQWVGYFDGSDLKKVPVTGSTPQTVVSSDVVPATGTWGADNTIIFGSIGGGLFRVSADGGEPESLTRLDQGENAHVFPQLLPDGNALLFTTVDLDNSMATEVLDLETRTRRVVRQGGQGRYAPTRHLVYQDQGTLFAVPFDLGQLQVKGSAVPVVQGLATILDSEAAAFDFSSTGTLAYLGGAAGSQTYPVVWVDRQGNTTPLWDEPGVYSTPRLSPDGTRLAVQASRNDNEDVWIYDLERGAPTRLTSDAARDTNPVWSPDGQFLAFSSDRDGPPNMYRTRADGSGTVARLTESDRAQFPESWSADGGLLAYAEAGLGTNYDLWVLPLEGDAEPRVIANSAALDTWLAFSPNGRWIAYASFESGRPEVYVQSFPPGPGRHQVSIGGGSQPRWSGDGRELFYRTYTGIMVVAVETEGDSFGYGTTEQLFEGSFRGGVYGMIDTGFVYPDYDVTADGQRFVMFPGRSQRQNDSDHVTLITNWFDELKRLVPADP